MCTPKSPFEYLITRSWVWILPLPAVPEVTLGGHSSGSLTIPRCKIGTGLVLGIQSGLWGSLCSSKSRAWAMMDPLWLWNPWAESTEVWNREQQWLHKMVTCERKNFLKKTNFTNISIISLTLKQLCAPCLWFSIGKQQNILNWLSWHKSDFSINIIQ